jgi:hypothetical protein
MAYWNELDMQLGEDLCTLLGLNPDAVTGISIKLDIGEPSEITVKHRLIEAGKQTNRRYTLAEVEESPEGKDNETLAVR